MENIGQLTLSRETVVPGLLGCVVFPRFSRTREHDYARSIPAGSFSPGWSETRTALEQEHGGRPSVWVVLTHVEVSLGADERKLWLHLLDQFGERLDELVMPPECDVSVHLYDFAVKKEGNRSRAFCR